MEKFGFLPALSDLSEESENADVQSEAMDSTETKAEGMQPDTISNETENMTESATDTGNGQTVPDTEMSETAGTEADIPNGAEEAVMNMKVQVGDAVFSATLEENVVLSGEGSDEMFAGYNEYYEPTLLKLYTKLPLSFRKSLRKLVTPFPHFPGQNTIKMYGQPFYERYIGHGSIMSEKEANAILKSELRDNETISDIIKPYYNQVKECDDVTKKMFIDMHFWLPQDILLKADKMTMANSVELRVPLLDSKLFDFARKIPTKHLIKKKTTKKTFREIANLSIPDEWANRRKLGFPVPFSKWLKEEKYYNLVKEYFNKEYVGEFFDSEYINNLLNEHYMGIKNNGRKIYNIYVFLIWYEVYFLKN